METSKETKALAVALRRQMSRPEIVLWLQIRGRRLDGLKFRRQHPIGPYVLDFYCPAARLAVEVDGEAHSVGVRPGRDQVRDRWLADQGIETLRIHAANLLVSADPAVRMILAAASARTPSVASRQLPLRGSTTVA